MEVKKKVRAKRAEITQKELMQALDYNPDTGTWTWIRCSGNKSFRNGTIAGSIRAPRGRDPWYVITINDYSYNASHLAWLYMMGEWPSLPIDHADCDGLNNQWLNLRLATHSQNNANRRSPKTKSSGLPKGVYDKGPSLQKRFGAGIKVNKLSIYLGMYRTAEEAHMAYCNAATEYFGEFARMT